MIYVYSGRERARARTHTHTHTHTQETVLKLENDLVYSPVLACVGIIPAADEEGGTRALSSPVYTYMIYFIIYCILYCRERERDVVVPKFQTDVRLFGGLTELTASKTKPPQMDAMVLKFQTDVCLFGGFSVPMRNAVSLSLPPSLADRVYVCMGGYVGESRPLSLFLSLPPSLRRHDIAHVFLTCT